MARYESYEVTGLTVGSFLNVINETRNPSEHMLSYSGVVGSVIVCLKFN